jgi:hypothetical protein
LKHNESYFGTRLGSASLLFVEVRTKGNRNVHVVFAIASCAPSSTSLSIDWNQQDKHSVVNQFLSIPKRDFLSLRSKEHENVTALDILDLGELQFRQRCSDLLKTSISIAVLFIGPVIVFRTNDPISQTKSEPVVLIPEV